MPDIQVIYWNIGSWVFAIVLAGIFLIGDLLGPYKGLYCCVKETNYRQVPTGLVHLTPQSRGARSLVVLGAWLTYVCMSPCLDHPELTRWRLSS